MPLESRKDTNLFIETVEKHLLKNTAKRGKPRLTGSHKPGSVGKPNPPGLEGPLN